MDKSDDYSDSDDQCPAMFVGRSETVVGCGGFLSAYYNRGCLSGTRKDLHTGIIDNIIENKAVLQSLMQNCH